MRIFTIIWFGQLVSLLGTAMTRFALLIWAYEQTGQATTLALLGFFSFGLDILLSPIAGVWVDRWDRRLVLLFADLGAGLMTATILNLIHDKRSTDLAPLCGTSTNGWIRSVSSTRLYRCHDYAGSEIAIYTNQRHAFSRKFDVAGPCSGVCRGYAKTNRHRRRDAD